MAVTLEQLGDDLKKENPNVSVSQMFGMPCLKVGKSAFAGYWREMMVFKLAADSPQHASALNLSGAKLFDPMDGRPMKEWVVVPATHSSEWPRLARASLAFVAAKK